jgi:hypothetical protein
VREAHGTRSHCFSVGLEKGRQGWHSAKKDQGLVLMEKAFGQLEREQRQAKLQIPPVCGCGPPAKNGFYISKWLKNK